MRLADLATYGVLAFIGYRLVDSARFALSPTGRDRTVAIVRGIRWRHVWPVPLVLAGVVAAASVLLLIPGMSFGWWTALGGIGNPVTGTTDATAGSPLAWIVPAVFLSLLFPVVPLFALTEEQIFRVGSEARDLRGRAWWAVRFGLAHALIGIPIGVALALSVGGAYFTWRYLVAHRASGSPTAAALESARAHTAYNWAILTLVVVLLATGIA